MNKRVGTIIVIFAILALIAMPFIKKANHTRFIDSKIADTTKTYEQGLWDGFNKTMKYLDQIGYIKDTVHIEITKLDSVLHSK